jgi:hypothetical protein
VCQAHTIGELISGDKSKTLCGRIYDTARCGRLTDINSVNNQAAVPEKVHWGQGDYSIGCAKFCCCFFLQSSLIKEIRGFLCVLTKTAEIEGISFLHPYVHFFQIEYYVLNGFH